MVEEKKPQETEGKTSRRGRPPKEADQQSGKSDSKASSSIQMESSNEKPRGVESTSNSKEIQPGDIVSIDLRKRKMVAVPGWKLTTDSPTAQVPYDIEQRWLNALNNAAINGDIFKGEKHIPAFEKDLTVIDEYIKCLKYPWDNFLKVTAYLCANRQFIRGIRTSEIASKMMEAIPDHVSPGQQKKYRAALEKVFQITGGVGPVTEAPVKSVKFKDPNREEFPVPR